MKEGAFSPTDWKFLAGLFLAVFIFFPEVFFLKVSFLSGDHRAQHYPWAAFLAENVKHFRLPWWTSYFHCGFPLLAEGQVGAFYPLNLFFYFFFPVFFAYTYQILFHYLLGGFFFYAYLRSIKLSSLAAFLGSLIYLFGTAQGGYYYNVISQKVLIWFPLTLLLCDQILERGKKRFVFWLALIFAVQMFAGYLQFAVYSIAFSSLYFCWFALRKTCSPHPSPQWGEGRVRGSIFVSHLGLLALSLILSAVIALPQLGSTLELAGFSRRFVYPLEFAFVGSMNPAALATLFFPQWDGFLRSEIYVGAAGLFFLLVSMLTRKSSKEIFFWVMAVLALALALGKFNPLYVLGIKLTQFSSFRVPAKFIFFAAFAFSVLCAFGFEKWWLAPSPQPSPQRGEGRVRGRQSACATAGRLFNLLVLTGVLALIISNAVLRFFEARIKGFFINYIQNHYGGTILHPRPLESYLQQFEEMYAEVIRMTSLWDFWIAGFIFFLILSAFWVHQSRKWKARLPRLASWGFIGITFLNLYFYSFTSIKGSLEPYSFVEPPSKIIDFLKDQPAGFRIHRLLEKTASSEELPLVPHNHMLYGLSITGAYSPLVLADYYDYFEALGDINDSQRLIPADVENVKQSESRIDFLSVKYLLSDYRLEGERYRFVLEENGGFLYDNPHALPRAFFIAGDVPETERISLDSVSAAQIDEAPSQQEIRIQGNASGPGFLIMSDLYYPGWKAEVNGHAVEILKAGKLFRAIRLEKEGAFDARLRFEPVWKKGVWIMLVFSFVCLIYPMLAPCFHGQKKDIQGP